MEAVNQKENSDKVQVQRVTGSKVTKVKRVKKVIVNVQVNKVDKVKVKIKVNDKVKVGDKVKKIVIQVQVDDCVKAGPSTR